VSRFLCWFADRCVFVPTRDQLPTEGKARRLIPFQGGTLEAYVQQAYPGSSKQVENSSELHSSRKRAPELFVLKLGGTAGRAERATTHPFEAWPDVLGEVWALNPPGYGGSTGPASLSTFAAAAKATFDALRAVAGDRPIVVAGNSLGTMTALYLAALEPKVAGVILRNPVPLRELIRFKYGWKTLGLGPRLVGTRIPPELDSILNAKNAHAPLVVLTSMADRMVPPVVQRQVIDAYAGPKTVVELAGADHAFELTAEQQHEYLSALRWLRGQLLVNPENESTTRSPGIDQRSG
jgi:uncharacterized protein